MTRMWHEPIYIEGGPEWKHDCTGRGDIALIKPVDNVFLFPGDGCQYEYVRTTRTWISSLNSQIHTIFSFKGPVVCQE